MFVQGLRHNAERIITCKPIFFSISNRVPIKEEVFLSASWLKCYSVLYSSSPCWMWRICFLSVCIAPFCFLRRLKFTWPRNGKEQVEEQSSALQWFYLVEEISHHKLSWRCVQALVFTNKTEQNSWWLTHTYFYLVTIFFFSKQLCRSSFVKHCYTTM